MTKRILVMGLPGAGKTTFTQELVKHLMLNKSVAWFNADTVRAEYDDWDFSADGRKRQVHRMRELADRSGADYAICDFVCPTEELRKIFDADIIVWLDTIEAGRYEDTNRIFEPPVDVNYHITDWDLRWRSSLKSLVRELTFETERSSRSVAKALTWRALGTLDTFLLSWVITGEWRLAAAIGGTEVITKMILYYLHERAWARVKWRR